MFASKQDLRIIWNLLPKKRKVELWLLVVLMVFSSLSEAASLGALLPFIWFLSGESDNILGVLSFTEKLGLNFELEQHDRLQFVTIVFLSVFFLASLVRSIVLWSQTRLSQSLAADLAIKIYDHALSLSFSYHVKHNSSKSMSGVLHKANSIVVGVIFPILVVINAVLVFSAIFISLLLIHSEAALFTSFLFGGFYCVVLYASKVKMRNASKAVNFGENRIIQILQEGYKSIRDILISGRRDFFVQQFEVEERRYRKAVSDIQIYSTVPKIFAETFGVFTIIGLAVYLRFESDNFLETVPILAALALGAQRLLPIMQMVYSSLSLVRGHKDQVSEIIETLSHYNEHVSQISYDHLEFETNLTIKNVALRLSDTHPTEIFRDVSLKIEKGEKIGIIGETGSGKSTFINVLAGLLTPTTGVLQVDGKEITNKNLEAWQKNISLVPQEIALLDGTIAQNIVFDRLLESSDVAEIEKLLAIVELSDFVSELKYGINTRIGENGSHLSGGQRQRLGLARGLFRGSKILILDEATSALDNQTEKRVLNNIWSYDKHLTVIMVTHSKSNLDLCSKVFSFEYGASPELVATV